MDLKYVTLQNSDIKDILIHHDFPIFSTFFWSNFVYHKPLSLIPRRSACSFLKVETGSVLLLEFHPVCHNHPLSLHHRTFVNLIAS